MCFGSCFSSKVRVYEHSLVVLITIIVSVAHLTLLSTVEGKDRPLVAACFNAETVIHAGGDSVAFCDCRLPLPLTTCDFCSCSLTIKSYRCVDITWSQSIYLKLLKVN